MFIEIDVLGHDVVTAHVGDDIVARLDEAPSTGYVWTLSVTGSALTGVDDGSWAAPDAAPGASGRREFTLRASAPGTAELVWRLARPWQPDVAADERRITVTVAA